MKFGPVEAGDKVTTHSCGHRPRDRRADDLRGADDRRDRVHARRLPLERRPHAHNQACDMTVTGAWDRLFADEHVTWIRGWPELDSPEVQALLVADALGPGAVPEHEMLEGVELRRRLRIWPTTTMKGTS